MQLFVTDLEINKDIALIKSSEIIHQLSRVLRVQIGHIFEIQNLGNERVLRYKLEILQIQKDLITCKILGKEEKKVEKENLGMIICLPNTFEKLELIIQKLTEIGIPNIVLRASHRSVIREINEKKFARLNKIIIEACEQSKSWVIPNIKIIKDFRDFAKDKKIIIFNFEGEKTIELKDKENIYAIVGPEGGFDDRDWETLSPRIYKTLNLGKNVLRTETGAIIGGRLLKNSF